MLEESRYGGETCLHLAVTANSLDIVKLLVAEGVDVNRKNATFISPLHIACMQNYHFIAKHLLEK